MATRIPLTWQTRLGVILRKGEFVSVWEVVDTLNTGREGDPDVNMVHDTLELLYRMGFVRKRYDSANNGEDNEYQLVK